MSRIGKYINRDSRLVIARAEGWGWGWARAVIPKECRFLSEVTKMP